MHQITRVISYQIKNRLPFIYITGFQIVHFIIILIRSIIFLCAIAPITSSYNIHHHKKYHTYILFKVKRLTVYHFNIKIIENFIKSSTLKNQAKKGSSIFLIARAIRNARFRYLQRCNIISFIQVLKSHEHNSRVYFKSEVQTFRHSTMNMTSVDPKYK